MRKIVFAIFLLLILIFSTTAQEERFFNWAGIVYSTTVNRDMVNVHRQPSLQSEIISQISMDESINITGTSSESDIIDGYEGHWLLVHVDYRTSWNHGWVFSAYVNIENIRPNELKVIGLTPEEPGRARRLNVMLVTALIQYPELMYGILRQEN